MAIAGDSISTERPSNRMDIAYRSIALLQGVHFRRQAASAMRALFMRSDQEFLWAPDLKADLARLNANYLRLPEAERIGG